MVLEGIYFPTAYEQYLAYSSTYRTLYIPMDVLVLMHLCTGLTLLAAVVAALRRMAPAGGPRRTG